MEALVTLLNAYGLTGAVIIILWGIIKYYVGGDIQTTKTGILANAKAHTELAADVKELEDDVDKRFLKLENEFKLNKVEQATGLALIQTSLLNISHTLTQHIEREAVYQDKIDKFMGYAYRKLGNGHLSEE